MFTLEDYVGPHSNSPDWTPWRQDNAKDLIEACAGLQEELELRGVHFPLNPKTKTTISGEKYGGFRPQDCTIGAPHSAHKQALAVDRYDPAEEIDNYLMEHQDLLEKFDIYIEHPDSTPGWSHWSIRPPKSGKHVFIP
jgi:hypothetical protein